MLDDGLLRRFNCLAMVSKDYKSESRTVSRLECCQHCTKEFQLIFKPKKKIKERKQTNILFLHWFQNTGIPVLRFLLRLIHHWLLVHVCIYVNGLTYRSWSFIWDCTHILHYIANHSRKVFSTCHVCTICFVYILQIHVQFCAKVGAFVFCIHIHVQILNTWSMHVQVPVAFDKVLITEEAVIIYLLVFKNWNIIMLSDFTIYIYLKELNWVQCRIFICKFWVMMSSQIF